MKTNWYTDSPRARTHAGRFSCIEALSVDSDSIHDAPPTNRASEHDGEVRHQRQHDGGHRESRRRHRQQGVLAEPSPQPRQQEGAEHRTRAQRAQQQPVPDGRQPQPVRSRSREAVPTVALAGRDEQRRPQQDSPHDR